MKHLAEEYKRTKQEFIKEITTKTKDWQIFIHMKTEGLYLKMNELISKISHDDDIYPIFHEKLKDLSNEFQRAVHFLKQESIIDIQTEKLKLL